MRKNIMAVVVLLLIFPGVSFGAMELDLRIKGGTAAGADEMMVEPLLNLSGSGDDSRNFQVELNFLPLPESTVSPVLSVGLFDRRHSGTVSDLFFGLPPTAIDYNVSGLTFAAGVRIRADQNLHFEGKIELAGGQGEPTLSTIDFAWNPIKEDGYGSTTFIVGGYYTFNEPALQLGLEIGAQAFTGDFKIWNNSGFWNEASIEGSGGIVNLVLGYRF